MQGPEAKPCEGRPGAVRLAHAPHWLHLANMEEGWFRIGPLPLCTRAFRDLASSLPCQDGLRDVVHNTTRKAKKSSAMQLEISRLGSKTGARARDAGTWMDCESVTYVSR